jgi:hypothetical protein
MTQPRSQLSHNKILQITKLVVVPSPWKRTGEGRPFAHLISSIIKGYPHSFPIQTVDRSDAGLEQLYSANSEATTWRTNADSFVHRVCTKREIKERLSLLNIMVVANF